MLNLDNEDKYIWENYVEIGKYDLAKNEYLLMVGRCVPENNYELISDMTASLIINKATYDMSGITFPSDVVIYNGYAYNLAIVGTLPEGVTVEYENNEKITVGTYTITAKFSGDEDNYELRNL